MQKIIAEFEIGVDTLLKNATDAKKAINDLTEQQKSLRKSGDQSSQSFVQNEVALKKLRSEYGAYTKGLTSAIDSKTKENNLQKNTNTLLGASITSINGARKSNAELLKIRNQLNLSTDQGKKAQEEINKKISENNTFIKENVTEQEKQKIGIGGYEQAVTSALGKVNIFGISLNTVSSTLGKVTGGTLALSKAKNILSSSSSKSSKALKIFRLALISTGIGAIVVLIGALVAGFLSTQRGIDAVSKALAPLKGAFNGVIGVVQTLAGSVFNVLKANFTITKNVLLGGMDVIRLAWAKVFGTDAEVEAIQKDIQQRFEETKQAALTIAEAGKDIAKTFSEAGDNISKASKAQQEIVKLGIEIENQENKLIITRNTLLDQIKQQEEIAKNTTLSSIERNKAIEEAKRLSDELALSETNILDLKIQQKTLQNEQNDTSREEQAELNQLIADRTAKETEARARDLKFLGSRNSIIKEQQAAAKKAQDQAIKNQEISLQLFIIQNDLETSSLNDKLKLTESIYQKELEIIDKKQKAGLSNDEAEIERIEAKNKKLADQVTLTAENAQAELDLYLLQNDALINGGAELNDALLAQKLDFYDESERLQIEALEKQLLNDEEFAARKAIIEAEAQASKKSVTDELEKIQKEEDIAQEALDFENKLIRLELQDATQQEINLERRERDRELAILKIEEDVLSEEDRASRIALVNKNYDEQSLAFKKINENLKLNIAQETFGNVANLLGEETKAGKAAAIAQATINTYKGVTEVLRAKSTIPEPFGTASKIINTGVVLGAGFKAVKKIVSTKAEKGITFQGTLKGNSHANGGIDLGNGIEAEGGENVYGYDGNTMIMNKQASVIVNERGLLGALSYINQGIGGGVPLSTPTNYANDGGTLARSLTQRSNTDVANALENSVQTIKVVNIAEETAGIINDGVRVNNEANF